ncbi:uncharacterized protein CMU_007100 [Cryptosporidium muris RN66]|uniref:Transmembrane protein n=1 Tax=Cryptosporidium muris (strain RN66) TaxID=441375 RepID=B6ADD0_CRYMR|nr:uncharacterized protein CMU_007100 [Cryptosporidium muris RN66]EEA06221.1 hypothetical protein, conserved [Cryptosporidium muris RN66]|eukprot:XP_002140570.1 hypothetical protein [Cryptosporidium muris RN66]
MKLKYFILSLLIFKFFQTISCISMQEGYAQLSGYKQNLDSSEEDEESDDIQTSLDTSDYQEDKKYKSELDKYNKENEVEQLMESDQEIELSENIEDKSKLTPTIKNENNNNILSDLQYRARQQKLHLSQMVYPGIEGSQTNYIFLPKNQQTIIDNKIKTLQKSGYNHGSTRETMAIGEWRKRYYARPQRPVTKITLTNQFQDSTLGWVLIGVVFTSLFILGLLGIRYINKS